MSVLPSAVFGGLPGEVVAGEAMHARFARQLLQGRVNLKNNFL